MCFLISWTFIKWTNIVTQTCEADKGLTAAVTASKCPYRPIAHFMYKRSPVSALGAAEHTSCTRQYLQEIIRFGV